MVSNRVRMAGIVSIGALVLLSACGKSNSTTPSSGGTQASQQSGAAQVRTSSVSGIGTALVDSKGDTLYYLKSEMSGKINCTGSCASAWPPDLLPAGTKSPTAGAGVTGKLGTIK